MVWQCIEQSGDRTDEQRKGHKSMTLKWRTVLGTTPKMNEVQDQLDGEFMARHIVVTVTLWRKKPNRTVQYNEKRVASSRAARETNHLELIRGKYFNAVCLPRKELFKTRASAVHPRLGARCWVLT